MHDRIRAAANLLPPDGGITRLLSKREQRREPPVGVSQVLYSIARRRVVLVASVVLIGLVLVQRNGPLPVAIGNSEVGADWPQRALDMQRLAEAAVSAQRLEISAPDAKVRIYLVAAQHPRVE